MNYLTIIYPINNTTKYLIEINLEMKEVFLIN